MGLPAIRPNFSIALMGSLFFLSFRVSAGMGLPSETKIEPDRRVGVRESL